MEKERAVAVAAWFFSPEMLETTPAVRAILAELRQLYDVERYPWPCIKGSPDVEPTWQAALDLLLSTLDENTHLLTLGPDLGLSLMAAHRQPVRSYVSTGFLCPTETLYSLGDNHLADLANLAYSGLLAGQQLSQLIMEGASEEEKTRYAHLMDASVDWPRAQELAKSLLSLDLVRERVRVESPALLLEIGLNVPVYSDGGQFFLKFVPGAQVRSMAMYPGKLHMESSGREFALPARELMRAH